MNAEQMWAEFTARNPAAGADYEAWAYGGDADTLARLTLTGGKTATASAFPLYALEGEPLPEAGEYSVILDSRKEAVCVIRTERVVITPFQEVGAEHARREGEGDRSLAYWRKVHQSFFTHELSQAGLSFYPDMPVVCEYFRCVWPEGISAGEVPAEAPAAGGAALRGASLREMFLQEMRAAYDAASDEGERERIRLAEEMGLAALEGSAGPRRSQTAGPVVGPQAQ